MSGASFANPRRWPRWGRTRMGHTIGVGSAALAALGIALCLAHPAARLIYNATASAPLGFYWLDRDAAPQRGEFVLAWAPSAARRLRRGAAICRSMCRWSNASSLFAANGFVRTAAPSSWMGTRSQPVSARPRRPRAAALAGLPRARHGRCVSAHGNRPGLVRRAVFRGDCAPSRDRQVDPAMDLVTFTTLCALHGSPLLTPCPATSQPSAVAAPLPALSQVDLTPWRARDRARIAALCHSPSLDSAPSSRPKVAGTRSGMARPSSRPPAPWA